MKVMKGIFNAFAILFLINCGINAQSIIVNPDGTHSLVFNNGSTSTVVKPDGSFATIFNNGSTSTLIDPDGTHSTFSNIGSTSIIVNPNGTHSIFFNNENKIKDEITVSFDTTTQSGGNNQMQFNTDTIKTDPSFELPIEDIDSDTIYMREY